MRWFNFAILVFITLVLQIGVCKRIGIGQQRIMPDLLLLTAVILAFRAPANHALIACWVLGFAKDVTSSSPLGSYALCFGLMALLLVRMREVLYGMRSVTLIIVTFGMSLLIEQAVYLFCVLKDTASWDQYSGITFTMLLSAMITGGLAPYGFWLITKFHRQLGLQRDRSFSR
jgi:rod shape-determining protein MreD